ncbi:MAG: HAMP domain-containing sensor histidine kinase [Cyanobacteria bacterium J06621_11]
MRLDPGTTESPQAVKLSTGAATQPSLKPLWKQLLSETRTRILLLYGLLLLLISGLSIPIFRYLLFINVDARVEEDLIEERDFFLTAYTEWETAPNQTTAQLQTFIQRHFSNVRLEDDNYQIVLIEGKLIYSNPGFLIKPLSPGSELFSQWQTLEQSTIDQYATNQSEIGEILYTVDPLVLEGERRGTFVTAHSSAGERQEALVGVYLLMKIMAVVLCIALALSWLSAGKIMAPIAELAITARSISESDLTQRIPTPPTDGELAELANIFNAMMDRIQSAFDSQRKFINDAGHELRTPITIIQGHLELLDDDPQERQETMELVMDELDRMGRLVSDLILLAKSERPNFLQIETIDIRHFAEIVFAKATALTQREWQLTLDESVQAEHQLLGDRQKLTGALLNLLRNAAQHTQETDTIELGCRIVDSNNAANNVARQIQFWVRDTGAGMTTEEQQYIFDRFARGRHRRADGAGLGLAITSAVIEAHKGRIELESRPNLGSTFRVMLPIANSHPI